MLALTLDRRYACCSLFDSLAGSCKTSVATEPMALLIALTMWEKHNAISVPPQLAPPQAPDPATSGHVCTFFLNAKMLHLELQSKGRIEDGTNEGNESTKVKFYARLTNASDLNLDHSRGGAQWLVLR